MDHFATKPISADRLAGAIAKVSADRAGPPRMAEHDAPGAAAPAPAGDERAAVAGAFDASVLDGLARDIGRAPAAELVRLFAETAPAQVQEMDAGAAAGRIAEVAAQAHSLAGTALGVGLRRLGEAARALEDRAALGSTDRLAEQLEELRRLLLEGLEALQGWRGMAG